MGSTPQLEVYLSSSLTYLPLRTTEELTAGTERKDSNTISTILILKYIGFKVKITNITPFLHIPWAARQVN